MALSIALLAAVLVGVTQWRAQSREAAAEAAYPPIGKIYQVDGVDMHVVVAGDGPDLVLIHGSMGSVRDFTFGLMPELAKSYRVFAVDRPGLGYSGVAPNGQTLAVQSRLIAQAAAAAGARNPLVLGQSYGGAVALNWAVSQPEPLSGLVLVSAPSHPWDTGLGRFYTVTSHPLGQAIVVPLITGFVRPGTVADAVENAFKPQLAPEGYAEHFGPQMSLRRSSLRANARQRAALLSEVVAMGPSYPSINLPVEIIHGLADTVVSPDIHARAMAEEIPGAVFTALPGIGHMPHHTAIPDTIDAVHRAATRAGLRNAL
ncbi:alpha/beta hydrolase [Actibacterium mucosum KCTC 23349]|uniref:Alpha/beta hydrolase n=1 Tax=Actibacterium mucosum KCTC 23349 TaxID=1454373 RepID=A0A037ZM65_9RHOB|nr:alpha/beta hydrolase [Actibacterium mucosum]KAJ56739.1 alpha/beta hydrolase [Actibacterium mucosum KCTC 23349]